MTATKTQPISQGQAIAIAAQHDFRVEINQLTTSDCWQVRIYSTAAYYRKNSYDRRRDLFAADVPNRILSMVAVAVHDLPWEAKLTTSEALDLLT